MTKQEFLAGYIIGWLNLIPLGQCDGFILPFAEKGIYWFRHSRGIEFPVTTREGVKAACQNLAHSVKALHVVDQFWDTDNYVAVALFDEYMNSGVPGAALVKNRVAVMMRYTSDFTIFDMSYIPEDDLQAQPHIVKRIVDANANRLMYRDCSLWHKLASDNLTFAVSPGNQRWKMHDHSEAKGLCEHGQAEMWQGLQFQNAEFLAVFPCQRFSIVFFRLEKLFEGATTFVESPLATLLWFTDKPNLGDAHAATSFDNLHVSIIYEFQRESMSLIDRWYQHASSAHRRLQAASEEVLRAAAAGRHVPGFGWALPNGLP